MKFILSLLAAAALVVADCVPENGVYYCSETKKVVFDNVGFSGSYNKVTWMDEGSQTCRLEPHSFLGNLAPLNEDLSVHFRGPLRLAQFAVYYPNDDNAKRDVEDCETRHVHHKHKRATQIVEVTRTVVVGGHVTTLAAKETYDDMVNLQGVNKAYRTDFTTKPLPTTTGGAAQPSAVSPGDWKRTSYYTPGKGDNVVFLNNFGDDKISGKWSLALGNSLSYCNKDNSGCSAEPVLLDDITLKLNSEFTIMSGQKCNDSCGYYRQGIPAYKGWAGDKKIFVFEFTMPHEGNPKDFNGDMPAIWMLNAQIPRTVQYGDPLCLCWSTGCGELDLFEVLLGGSDKMMAHLHTGQGAPDGKNGGGGGSLDYFKRPTDTTIKGAVIFNEKQIHIQILDDNTLFDEILSKDTVNQWLGAKGSVAAIY